MEWTKLEQQKAGCTFATEYYKKENTIMTKKKKAQRYLPLPEHAQLPVIDFKETGAKIKELCEEANLTIEDLQAYMGLSQNAYYKWFRGCSLPSSENLVHLSYLLQVPVDEILVVYYVDWNHDPVA